MNGPSTMKKTAYRPREHERRSLRMAERDPLRHELADDDVQERQDDEPEDHREHRREHRLEDVREERLAESTDRQRGDGDAELHRRDEPRRVARDLEHGPRASVPLAGRAP